jgi:hypothetical protein
MMRRMQAWRGVWTIHNVLLALAAGVGALGLGLVGLVVWTIASYWALFHATHDRYQAADVRPLRRIIASTLPVGSTGGRARAALRSRAVITFIAGRGFDTLAPATSLRRTPSFDDSLDESEAYPQGTTLFAGARNWGDGSLFSERYITVRLFFDARGRFTHCTVDESFATL